MTTLEKLEDLIYNGFQETDRRIQETDGIVKENARQLAELKKQTAGLTKSLGLFAESMVEPSVTQLFGERGLILTDVGARLRARRNGGTMEVDVLAAGTDTVVAVEAKLHLEIWDVKEFLKRLAHFFEYFPRYRGLKLYGAVAGMSIDDNVPRYAYKQGLFVLAPSGENMQILNDAKFVPRLFNETEIKKTRRKK